MKISVSAAVLAVAVFEAACESAPAVTTAADVVRHDSAGAEIVEVGGGVLSELPVWQLSNTPSVVIGGSQATAERVLDRVTGALILQDGRVVVVDGSTQEIRLFSPQGDFARSIGGRGQGPGEFERLTFVARHGSGLLAMDAGQRRMTVIDSAGSVSDVRPWSADGCEPRRYENAGHRCEAVGALSDGTVVTRQATRSSGGRSGTIPRVSSGLVAVFGIHTGTGINQVDSVTRPDEVVVRGGENFNVVSRRPFAPDEVYAVGASHLAVAKGYPFEVRLRDASGRLARILRVAQAARAVSSADLDSVRAATSYGGAILAVAEASDSVPHFDELRMDAAGRLWVRLYEGATWVVFEADGTPLARVQGEPFAKSMFGSSYPMQILDVGTDYVLGLDRDGLDAQIIVKYPVVR